MENNKEQLKQRNIRLRRKLKPWFTSQKVAAADMRLSPEWFNYFIKGQKDLGPKSLDRGEEYHDAKVLALLNDD